MNTKKTFPIIKHLVVLLLLFSLSACNLVNRTVIQTPTDQKKITESDQSNLSLLAQARKAKNSGQLLKAESLYLNASKELSKFNSSEKISIWQELAEVAHANGHTGTALNALNEWQKLDNKAGSTKAWQNLWYSVVNKLNSTESRTQAKQLYENTNFPNYTRALGGIVYAGRLLQAGLQAEAVNILENIAKTQEFATYRTSLEHLLLNELKNLDITKQASLVSLVTPQNEASFPYTVFLYRAASDQINKPSEDKTAAETILNRLKELGVMSGSAPDMSVTPISTSTPVLTGSSHGHGIALILPMSKALGNIGTKISQGARLAESEVGKSGVALKVYIIDSDSPNWETELKNISANIKIIGGPLIPKLYTQVKAHATESHKVLFTFLQNVDSQDEGQNAWRFFTSPEDQITALLNHASSKGISSFLSYAPDSKYGTKMSSVFEKVLAQKSLHLANSGTYPEKAPQEWNKNVASFLRSSGGGNNQAIFLPDNWKNIEIIVPNIFYHGTTKALFMGTNIWEQGLLSSASLGKIDARYYSSAVFPSAWGGENTIKNSAASRLFSAVESSGSKPDLWYGLGYDFIRLSSKLNIDNNWTAPQINAELNKTQGFEWTIAPMKWAQDGKATQELFLFTPTETGFEPIK
ncbi:penicillin-binding protein activator [Desulfovibrio litoralis]|uniref:ABC-type branched-chain amino acid transport system, substrate-binding protein n=1 Tax=Desulfovibrio litoralis DSM 11393 TaxID=1121455 RepID=A0A1M7SXJ5_9BACT|nr:penicillin-binding protein activator [Desulfovibrio litoralis]SHN63160.1 hypothetical protein SAMN02745728_01348 [Desulfovibrio litoralis DSM 11393]